MFSIFAFFLVAVIMLSLYKTTYRRRWEALATFPTMKKRFLINNSLELLSLSVHSVVKKIEEWQSELGEVFALTTSIFDSGMIVVNDPAVAEAVSFHQPDRSGTFLYKSTSRWIGKDGFFFALPKQAAALQKPIWSGFTPKNVGKYVENTNVHLNAWFDTIDKGEAIKFADIFSTARKFVLDIAFHSLMDYKLNATYGDNADYVESVRHFSELATMATFDIWSRIDFLHPFTSSYRAEQKNLKVMHGLTMEIVKERRRMFDDGLLTHARCVFDYYFLNKVDGRRFSDQEIREEVDAMIFGSHDTMQTSVGFLLFMMGKHPEIQQKVFEEVSGIISKDESREVTEEHVSQMPYAEKVVRESLRLFAPVPFVGRKLQSEITVGKFIFPKHAEVIFSLFHIGRNPKYFENPLEFNPERNLDNNYMPFSVGAKKCIGGKPAIIFLKAALAKFIRRFRITLPKGHDSIDLGCELVLTPTHDVPLIFEPRNEAN